MPFSSRTARGAFEKPVPVLVVGVTGDGSALRQLSREPVRQLETEYVWIDLAVIGKIRAKTVGLKYEHAHTLTKYFRIGTNWIVRPAFRRY